uniref:Uncharacterized protein n=1 Tax=Spongospora subterranea TaxID=70186 RepID=A0A0H5RB47_9EUKA|eukprot:CRZ11263.1 hypothetical protein [Spongospora subterranea]
MQNTVQFVPITLFISWKIMTATFKDGDKCSFMKDANHLQVNPVKIDAFDAKTPRPAEWNLPPIALKCALLSRNQKLSIIRLQAMCRGFICRRHLELKNESPQTRKSRISKSRQT